MLDHYFHSAAERNYIQGNMHIYIDCNHRKDHNISMWGGGSQRKHAHAIYIDLMKL